MPYAVSVLAEHGARPALQDSDMRLSYAQLAAWAEGLAGQLHAEGLRRGQVAGIVTDDRITLAVATLAVWRLGAIASPIGTWISAPVVGELLHEAEVALVLVGPGRAAEVPDDLRQVALDRMDPARGRVAPPVEVADDDLAFLGYTSGTTDRPKGVLLDHGNVRAMVTACQKHFGLGQTDHGLLALPLLRATAYVLRLLPPLCSGVRLTLHPELEPRELLQRITELRPTYLSTTSASYALLAALPDDHVPDTGSVRFAFCGPAPVGGHLATACRRRFGWRTLGAYGLVEATCVSAVTHLDDADASALTALPGVSLRIVDPEGRDLPPGDIGQILVSGPMVMRGYQQDGAMDDRAFTGGWLETGDRGSLDDRGRLRLSASG